MGVQSTNFEFLRASDERLARLAGDAERYFASDSSAALVKLRAMGEHMVRLVAAHQALSFNSDVSFDDVLRALRSRGLLPQRVGDAYEGLLQKMAEETKRGAGQYFTPRALIQVMVRLMQPQTGEVIQDPATGTGGFLIAADQYMKAGTDDYFRLSPQQQAFQLSSAFRGVEMA